MAVFDLVGKYHQMSQKAARDQYAATELANKNNETARSLLGSIRDLTSTIGKSVSAGSVADNTATVSIDSETLKITVLSDNKFELEYSSTNQLKQAGLRGKNLSDSLDAEAMQEAVVLWVREA